MSIDGWCARIYVERMQELTEDAVCYNFAKSKIKIADEGIPANSRNVNRSTRQKISGREERPGVVAGVEHNEA
jgi:hypothetical protein